MAYINQKDLDAFGKKYDCKVELTTFNTMTEAIAKLRSGQFDFDVFVPTVDVLGQLVAGKIIRPLNHSYIPNISQAWTEFPNPFYDQNWQYTVPYTIYTTGMAWRKDHVPENPDTMANRLGLALAGQVQGQGGRPRRLPREHVPRSHEERYFDLNTSNTAAVEAATNALLDLDRLVNLHIDNNDYSNVPSGQIWIHHAWSGDMAAAAGYMPKGTPVDVIGYWFPPTAKARWATTP